MLRFEGLNIPSIHTHMVVPTTNLPNQSAKKFKQRELNNVSRTTANKCGLDKDLSTTLSVPNRHYLSAVYVEMTDLLREFNEPAVMDIKMGVRYELGLF